VKKGKPEREPLTRERVLSAALKIVDNEGLEELSMRRLGQELGVEAMSLYNHVASKAELLDGVFEVVLSGLPSVPADRSWIQGVRILARGFRSVLSAHPNAVPLFADRPAVSEGSLRYVEAALGLLDRAGFSFGESIYALQSMVAFVVGHALVSRATPDADPRYHLLPREQFPHLTKFGANSTRLAVDDEFEFGLEAMVQGLRVRARALVRTHKRASGRS
jgi:AcrR family transcriptional regulator